MIFGGDGADAVVDLAALGTRGFAIDSPATNSFSAVPGGDINGDGRTDIIASELFGTGAGRVASGRVFVIFGKTDYDPVNLDLLGAGGFEIDGSQPSAYAFSSSHVGDLNNDGRDEVLLIEFGLDRATLLYGKTSTTTVDLASIGSAGYRITGPVSPGVDSASRVGDVNGDGLDDLGFSGGCGGGACSNGRTWISFGKTDTTAVDLTALGSRGFSVTGNLLAGADAAGDVNGDGKADIAVSDYNTAQSFVVFGRTATSTLSFASLGSAGFRISSTSGGTLFGIGDIDGDGLDDLATGARVGSADDNEAAVIFGTTAGSLIDAGNILDKGFMVTGGAIAGAANTGSFASAPLIAVNYPLDSPFGRDAAGSVRLISAPAPTFDLPTKLVYTTGGHIAPVLPKNIRRSSPIKYSISPALPDGLSLDPDTGAISGRPQNPHAAADYVVQARDRIGTSSRVITIRIDSGNYSTLTPVANAVTPSRPTFAWSRASKADDSEPVNSYTLMLDGQPFAEFAADRCGADRCELPAPTAIPDGRHVWHVSTTARDGHLRSTDDTVLTVADPPQPRLALTRPAVHTDEPVGLDASQSTDPNGGIRRFEFDLDGDGRYETDSGSNPRQTTTFGATGDYRVAMRLTDVSGLMAEVSATVHVTPKPPAGELGVSINNGAIATNDPRVTVSLVWPRLAETALISNDGGFGPAGATRSIDLAAVVPWTLASSGPERLPKIVYVRFRAGESGRETYTDDIILDQRAPNVSTASLTAKRPGIASSANARAARTAVLRATGRDDNAGIRQVEVAKRRGGKPILVRQMVGTYQRGKRKATARVRIRATLRKVYVRVTDVAGNHSKWRAVRRHTPRKHV